MYNNNTTGKPKEERSFWGTLFSPFTFPSKFQKFSQAFDTKAANLEDAQKKTREIMHQQTEQAKVEMHQQTEQAITENHQITQESIEDLKRYAAKAPALRH